MTLSKHKFLLLGVLLALIIGAGLAVLNHFVREENTIHEADMAPAYQAKAVKSAMPLADPTKAAHDAPTKTAPPQP